MISKIGKASVAQFSPHMMTILMNTRTLINLGIAMISVVIDVDVGVDPSEELPGKFPIQGD